MGSISCREIAKLAIAWQAAAFGRADATLDRALLEEVLEVQLSQKALKRAWSAHEHEVYEAITDTGPAAPWPAAEAGGGAEVGGEGGAVGVDAGGEFRK